MEKIIDYKEINKHLGPADMYTQEEARKYNPAKDMIKYKGKDYLEVKFRVEWFWSENKGADVKTERLLFDPERGIAEFRTDIFYPDGRHWATGHGIETRKEFADFYQKAETNSIGRAMALAGYGTTACQDLDEGRVVDAPNTSKNKESIKRNMDKWNNRKDERPVSEAQVRLLNARAQDKDIILQLKAELKIDSLKDLKRYQMDSALDRIADMAKNGIPKAPEKAKKAAQKANNGAKKLTKAQLEDLFTLAKQLDCKTRDEVIPFFSIMLKRQLTKENLIKISQEEFKALIEKMNTSITERAKEAEGDMFTDVNFNEPPF